MDDGPQTSENWLRTIRATVPQLQYSQRHTMINHCDRRITHLSDTDISFVLFNIQYNLVKPPPSVKPDFGVITSLAIN